jgi:CheY-like chemotaxis protein
MPKSRSHRDGSSACRVLLVEDCPDLAENIAQILELEGHVVVSAMTAEGALEVLKSNYFDGLLTDLRLPGKSGLDLIRTIRRDDATLPVVLMTAFADRIQRDQAQLEGTLEVLSKPVDLRRLLVLVAGFPHRHCQLPPA